MPDVDDSTAKVTVELRANGGKVGGSFEGAPKRQKELRPGFAGYERQAEGVRTIPVLLRERR
jgi:hypothetical protein